MENIAKSTSYGCYLDCDFETAKYPDDKTHIVGLLAEYVYDLEQRILHYDERYIKLWNEIETLRECVSKEFDQEQKIADLEAKLAESEKERELDNSFWKQECDSLQKQLAESENQCRECKHLNKKIELNIKNKLMAENCELQKQLAEKEKSLSIKSVVRTLMKDNNLNCTFRDKTNAQIQQCGDVYNSNYGYFNFEDDYDESLNNKTDTRFDITSIDLTDQDKISFAVEQLEQLKKLCQEKFNWWENSEWEGDIYDKSDVSNAYFDIEANIENQIEELKKEMK